PTRHTSGLPTAPRGATVWESSRAPSGPQALRGKADNTVVWSARSASRAAAKAAARQEPTSKEFAQSAKDWTWCKPPSPGVCRVCEPPALCRRWRRGAHGGDKRRSPERLLRSRSLATAATAWALLQIEWRATGILD